jgi:mRNA interferase RelE/StbE
MSWRVELKPTAEKQYLKLDRSTRKRIKKTLTVLQDMDDPLRHPAVRSLTGGLRGDYRIRIGKWRALFTPDPSEKKLHVYAILPRGNAY